MYPEAIITPLMVVKPYPSANGEGAAVEKDGVIPLKIVFSQVNSYQIGNLYKLHKKIITDNIFFKTTCKRWRGSLCYQC